MTRSHDYKSLRNLIEVLLARFLPERYKKLSPEEFEAKATKIRFHFINQLDDAIDDKRRERDDDEPMQPRDPGTSPSVSPSASERSDSTISCRSPQQATTPTSTHTGSDEMASEVTQSECEIMIIYQNKSPTPRFSQPCTSPASTLDSDSQKGSDDHVSVVSVSESDPDTPQQATTGGGSGMCNGLDDTRKTLTHEIPRVPQVMTARQACSLHDSERQPPTRAVMDRDCTSSFVVDTAQSHHTPLNSLSRVLYEEQTPLGQPKAEIDRVLDYAANCSVGHQCLIQSDKIHVIVRNSTVGHDMIITHNPLDPKASTHELNIVNKNIFCPTIPYIIFNFCNNITLLTGKVDNRTLHLTLYQLDTMTTCASWRRIPFSQYSISDALFDLGNCIPISHREDVVIVVSILNDPTNGNHRIVFHIFTQKTSGRKWKVTSSLLPIQLTRTVEYRIQSCQLDRESRYLYVSVWLCEIGAYIYKFDLMSLQQHRRNAHNVSIKPVCHWHIKEPTLHKCYLSLMQEEIVMISFNSIKDKTVMKIKRPVNFLPVSPADYQFEFPSRIKVIKTSIVSASKILVIYCDNTGQWFIRTIII